MDGPKQPGGFRVVPDGGSDLSRQPREARVGDEGVRPQLLVDLPLGHGPGPCLQEQSEELKGLGGEILTLATSQQLSGFRVVDALAEAQPQREASANLAIPEGFAKDINAVRLYLGLEV